jgi:hypothetical protein
MSVSRPDFMLGHMPVGKRPNVRNELKRIRINPLLPLLEKLGYDGVHFTSDDLNRYVEAYQYYYLSMDRYLTEMSVAASYRRQVKDMRRSGPYSNTQRSIADEYKKINRFLEYDMANCLIHARILMDRVAGVAGRFIKCNPHPSFMSFNEHRKFFAKLKEPFHEHEEYAAYIRENTAWFEMPLKTVRDQFVVHSAPKHIHIMAYPSAGYELEYLVMLPNAPAGEKPFSQTKVISVNAIRLSLEIQEFLEWFNDYGIKVRTKIP